MQLAWCVLALFLIGLLIAQLRQTAAQAHTICVEMSCEGAQITRDQLHLIQSAGISLDAYGIYAATVVALFACVYWTVAGTIIWRRPSDNMAIITAFTLLLFGGLTFDSPTHPPPGLPPSLWLAEDILELLGGYGMFLFFLLFPNGRMAIRWPGLLILLLVILQAGEVLARHSSLRTGTVPLLLSSAAWGLAFAALIYVQIYRYRQVSNPLERQQTKWVVFGCVTAIAGLTGTFSLYALTSWTGISIFSLAAFPATHAAALLIPLSIGVAILRHRLWDVDVLINRTLVYGSLTASLVLVYVSGVVVLQALFTAVVGQQSELAIAISTLVIAALFTPLRHRFQAFIDQRFYRQKYDAARTLAAFQITLRDEIDLAQLSSDMVTVVQDTMQPAYVSLWLR